MNMFWCFGFFFFQPNEERNLLEEAKGFEPSGVMASQVSVTTK